MDAVDPRRTETLAELLRAALPPKSRDRLFSLDLIVSRWGVVVGKELGLRSEPALFRDGVLTVRVADARWGRTILKLQSEIIPRLNAALGVSMVRRINFLRDGRSLTASRAGGSEADSRARPEPPASAAILEVAKRIEDLELRDQVIRTAARYLFARNRKSGGDR